MSGTDRSKQSVPEPQPVFVLVEPQMGENIGAAARGMLNFGLTAMRLVAPRDGWPNEKAGAMAAGASAVLDSARVFDDLAAAVGDCSYVMATTARPRDMRKPVFSPEDAAARLAEKVESGVRCAVLFGCER
ncbi:MAG: RNA methyltransferase [Pseudomonadota bacterium]